MEAKIGKTKSNNGKIQLLHQESGYGVKDIQGLQSGMCDPNYKAMNG